MAENVAAHRRGGKWEPAAAWSVVGKGGPPVQRRAGLPAYGGAEGDQGCASLLAENRGARARVAVIFALAGARDRRHRSPMRIAVLADTHNRYPPTLPERLRNADEIWHLGDVCAPDTLVEFEQLGPPLRVVLGNCDATNLWPLTLDLEREGVRFHLVHIPPARAPAGAQIVLHGHTHVPRDETDPACVRWLNPGCITRPNRGAGPSFAWLTVTRGKLTRWELMRV